MEIKFRGFRADGKGWVYGYVTRDNLANYQITTYSDDFYFSSTHLVITESVGMFVGITDKNGKEIYGSINHNKGGDIMNHRDSQAGEFDLDYSFAVEFKNGAFVILYRRNTLQLY
jgi:hypothetical protein